MVTSDAAIKIEKWKVLYCFKEMIDSQYWKILLGVLVENILNNFKADYTFEKNKWFSWKRFTLRAEK